MKPEKEKIKDHYLGHRKRVKSKFLKNSSNFADYELLELLLFSSHPRKDMKPLAKKLLTRFGSINAILRADTESLTSIPDVNQNVLVSLKLIKEIIHKSSQQKIIGKPLIASWKELCDYCQVIMSDLKEEQFRILFLNNKHFLITEELIKSGGIEDVEIDIKTIVKKSLNFFAKSIILLHNHPTWNCKPSQSDITNTKKISNALQVLQIEVYDHLIIGNNGGVFSFKSAGLL